MPQTPAAGIAVQHPPRSVASTIRAATTAWAVTALYWLYSRTWRIRRFDVPEGFGKEPTIYAHWHGDELMLVGAFAGQGMAVMTSWSRDGSLMTRVLTKLGYRVSRGSSSKGGGSGLKGMVDAVKEGADAALAVDGPRGPIYEVKPGILKLAQITGAAIMPGGCAARRRHIFKKAWNKCFLPLPFSRCAIVYGRPMRVPLDATDKDLEILRRDLQEQLVSLSATARQRVMAE